MEAVSFLGAFRLRSKFDLILLFVILKLHAQQSFDSLLVNRCYESDVSQISLLLFGLLGEDVALVSMLSLNFSRSGKRKTLFRTGVGLHLWHS